MNMPHGIYVATTKLQRWNVMVEFDFYTPLTMSLVTYFHKISFRLCLIMILGSVYNIFDTWNIKIFKC